MDKTQNQKPILKQYGDFTKEDFQQYPIWVQCHIEDYDEPWYDDTDEETFRACIKGLIVSPSDIMYLVKSEFTLADGTKYEGFITPWKTDEKNNVRNLGMIQPNIFLDNGKRFNFWFGSLPEDMIDKMKESFYSAIGKSPKDIFPIAFKAEEGLVEGNYTGNIPGMCYEKDRQLIISLD